MSVGKTILDQIAKGATKDIVEGTLREITGSNTDLSQIRLNICKNCPLYMEHLTFGAMCNPDAYVDPSTNKKSDVPKEGYIQGCGCRLHAKTRVKHNHCPAGKW